MKFGVNDRNRCHLVYVKFHLNRCRLAVALAKCLGAHFLGHSVHYIFSRRNQTERCCVGDDCHICQDEAMPTDGFYSDELVRLTNDMLTIKPRDRPSVQQILQTPLITSATGRSVECGVVVFS